MKRLLILLTACDPIWGVHATLRDPNSHAIEDATVAVACSDTEEWGAMAARSDRDGTVHLGGLGSMFPHGCDIYVAKPGFRTQRIRYRDLCPGAHSDCERYFEFDLVLEPE